VPSKTGLFAFTLHPTTLSSRTFVIGTPLPNESYCILSTNFILCHPYPTSQIRREMLDSDK
jgi:hypothetical protein